jgi:hypothetical protein
MKTTKYILDCKKGYVGDFAFEWDLDGSKRAEHNKFVEQCKADGTYGEEFQVELELVHCPFFDDPKGFMQESSGYEILDFGHNKKK